MKYFLRKFTKLTRIYLKYIRKIFAGFCSIIPFVKQNSNQYPFAQEKKALGKDWENIGDDLSIAISKYKQKHVK